MFWSRVSSSKISLVLRRILRSRLFLDSTIRLSWEPGEPVREREDEAMTNAMPEVKSEPEWAAYVAIDWADQKHYWRLVPAGSQQHEQGELPNTPEAVATWAAGLQQRFAGRPIAVCLEQARGA